MQLLRCLCRFTSYQSELSFIITGTAFWLQQPYSYLTVVKPYQILLGPHLQASIQEALQRNQHFSKSTDVRLSRMTSVAFDQGFGDKLPCDISRPGVWWGFPHFILSNKQKCLCFSGTNWLQPRFCKISDATHLTSIGCTKCFKTCFWLPVRSSRPFRFNSVANGSFHSKMGIRLSCEKLQPQIHRSKSTHLLIAAIWNISLTPDERHFKHLQSQTNS